MSENTFRHHTGGVVQVRYSARFGSVPEPLLEDIRLDLDSRAVAAWLAVKPSGWQISVTSLRLRLSLHGKKMLGKDRWQRIARELESAGYLVRKKVNGHDGQWVWHITFNPVPATIDGSPGSGVAELGVSVNGLPVDGQAGLKVIPSLELPFLELSKNTTTTQVFPIVNSEQKKTDTNFDPKSDQILRYPYVTNIELSELKKLIQICRADARQNVLDEIEGIRLAGGIKRGVVALARALISKVESSEFSLSAGLLIQKEREKRSQNEKAIATARLAPKGVSTVISEEVIANLPPNMARRARECAEEVNRLEFAKAEFSSKSG
jgi:hypothetical protein